jgi:hypothetical protein
MAEDNERQQLINSIVDANKLLAAMIAGIRQDLLRLDEIGCAVSRSRTRASKMEEVRADWWAHFDYDVVQGRTQPTKEQRVRAERYELS